MSKLANSNKVGPNGPGKSDKNRDEDSKVRRKRSRKSPREPQQDDDVELASQEQATIPEQTGPVYEEEVISQQEAKVRVAFGGKIPPEQIKLSNHVTTTKYTILTWAPLSLLNQFKRAANVYFLIISILTCLWFSPKTPQSMIGTFAFVLILTMIKEGFEDYSRYKSDRELNNRKTSILDRSTSKFADRLWADIKVGDIVLVNKDEEIPADMLLINAPKEVVFVSTMNLDGETNLKDKELALKSVRENKLHDFKGSMLCQEPNPSIDSWECNLMASTGDSSFLSNATPCNIKNLLLRGCTLKNTNYCFGVVVYVGKQTKIYMNSKKAENKTSNLMKLMNKILYSVFIFQLLIISTFATVSVFWMQSRMEVHRYIRFEGEIGPVRWLIQLLTYWVAYSHMIPISLYVIIEVLKLGQAKLINNDVKMFFPEDMKYALCRNSDLIEELGQVEFVFSDKTGTLTQNKMEFKKSYVSARVLGTPTEDDPEFFEGMAKSSIDDVQESLEHFYKEMAGKTNKAIARRLLDEVGREEALVGQKVYDFFRLLAVCNTVVVEEDQKTGELQYQASSPDELALIQGAQQAGMILKENSSTSTLIENKWWGGKQEQYEVVAEFPFDSTRKRMSLVVKHEGQILLMCKGADSIMLPRCNFNSPEEREDEVNISQELLNFAKEGLRTLVVAQKVMTEIEYRQFDDAFQKLRISTYQDKEKKLNNLYDKYEQNLTFIGSTAIEDKLQNGVPETIAKLIEANIRVWVLTGDKQETAIEIGKSCKLIQEDMALQNLSPPPDAENPEKHFATTLFQLAKTWNIDITDTSTDLNKLSKQAKNMPRMSVVIDGPTLVFALRDPECRSVFFRICLFAASVICCRVSPKQKADVVALCKQKGPWITLAIGDGANDVPMIMEAHIGIGVRGKEGTQAVRSADYAVSQFMFLLRLILIHGRWGYRRVSFLVCYYFYKNILLVFTEIWFATQNGYSGQMFFPDMFPTMYNAIWTSWQCLFAYMIDQDVNDEFVFKYPMIYKAGQQGKFFNLKIFWRWIIFAIWHGATAYFGTIYGLAGPTDNDGKTQSHWFTSCIAFTVVVHIISIKIYIETVHWNWISFSTGLFCMALYYVSVMVMNTPDVSFFFQPQITGEIWNACVSPKAYMAAIVLPMIALIPDITYIMFQKIFYPTPTDWVMLKQANEHNWRYEDFDHIPQIPLPTVQELDEYQMQQQEINAQKFASMDSVHEDQNNHQNEQDLEQIGNDTSPQKRSDKTRNDTIKTAASIKSTGTGNLNDSIRGNRRQQSLKRTETALGQKQDTSKF